MLKSVNVANRVMTSVRHEGLSYERAQIDDHCLGLPTLDPASALVVLFT